MNISVWTPLIIAALLCGAKLARQFAPRLHFLHTAAGAWVIATFAGLVDAVAEAARLGGFHLAVIIPAISTFLLSPAIATSNPSLASDGTSKAPVALGKIAALLAPLLVVLSLAGCQTAGGQALKTCEVGKLPAVVQGAVVTAEQIAMTPSSAVADLEQAALSFLPGQFDCALEALAAWWSGGKKGEIAPQNQHAREVVAAYLAKHRPNACMPLRRRLYQRAVASYMLGGRAELEAAQAWAEDALGIETCHTDPARDVRMCRPLTLDDGVPESRRADWAMQ